ncbi:MAG: hypothetical protein HRT35_25425 [Algicola sp.]|nr:hypothetical protein [Algicola sp.]
MAKKRKAKIQLSKVDGDRAVPLSVEDRNTLPPYHHFVDAPDQSYRLFFEEPHPKDETLDLTRPNKKFLRKKSKRDPFRIVGDGVGLVGEDIAKTLAVLLLKKTLNGHVSAGQQQINHGSIKSFFGYINSLDTPPVLFSEINVVHLSGWLSRVGVSNAARYKLELGDLFDLHPNAKNLEMSHIMLSKQKDCLVKDINEIDFDEVLKTNDYSQRVHFQLLAYAYYEIELAEERLEAFESASVAVLGDDYIPVDQISVKNPVVKRLLDEGEVGFRKLFYHFYLCLQDQKAGKRWRKYLTNQQLFTNKLFETSERLYKNGINPFYKFRDFYNRSQPHAWPIHEGSTPPIFDYLSLTSKHHEVAIFLYSLITTGVNREVALSWQWSVNGVPWFENYDVQLGIHDSSAARDKRILLVGVKNKGAQPKPVIKGISINSPLFRYLKLLDRTRAANRRSIFDFGISLSCSGEYFTAFVAHYPVINDEDGQLLRSIETRRIRKSYAGYQLFSLLGNVKNAGDLVVKLKEALNHKSFDTTFSSYIMKSGLGRGVIDSAIVALTTDMLEKAMTFAGEIKEDNERSDENDVVFLCDCTDPSNPSHGLPIAGRCMRYDMCLGCERCEVYSEHLPAICFRILQYEQKLEVDPDVFKITLEDQLNIACDTVEKFKVKHSNGMALVEEAYVIANESMQSNNPLLPPILQAGAM